LHKNHKKNKKKRKKKKKKKQENCGRRKSNEKREEDSEKKIIFPERNKEKTPRDSPTKTREDGVTRRGKWGKGKKSVNAK